MTYEYDERYRSRRPLSIAELADQAHVDFDPRISLNAYIRSCDALLQQGRLYMTEDDLETAFILLVRLAKLAIEDLPVHHPQYKTADSAKRKRLKQAGGEALDLLSDIKPKISDRYERYANRKSSSPKSSRVDLTDRASRPNKSIGRPRDDNKTKEKGSSSDIERPPSLSGSPRNLHLPLVPQMPAQQEFVTIPQHMSYEILPSSHAPPSASFMQGPRYSRTQASRYDTAAPVEGLSRNLQQVSIASTTPRTYQYLGPALTLPPHVAISSPLRTEHLDHMSSHQQQQGYADNETTTQLEVLVPRPPIDYPAIDRPTDDPRSRPADFPLIRRSASLISVPRPPRPPKISTSALPISASKLGKATTEDGAPLRDVLCPHDLIDTFVRLASVSTERNCETCGYLLGTLSEDIFTVKVLLIPRQRGTSDTCEATDEEAIFNFQDSRDLQTLAWIHTHPRQSCFLSSLDLHTHFAMQTIFAESVAIVCAPRKTPSIGIFRLTDPPGLGLIGGCLEPGAFHPHPNQPIYTDADQTAGHFHLVRNLELEVVDMR